MLSNGLPESVSSLSVVLLSTLSAGEPDKGVHYNLSSPRAFLRHRRTLVPDFSCSSSIYDEFGTNLVSYK
jgi:hypothetical protein